MRRHVRTGWWSQFAQANRAAKVSRRSTRIAVTRWNDTARGFERTIPTSGPGRRRAKALRNKAAVDG